MTLRTILAAAAVTILLGAPGLGLAQQSAAVPGAAGEYRKAKDHTLTVPGLNLTVGQIDDMNVLGPGGVKVGEIDEVLMDSSGQLIAMVVDVDKSVGIGDKEVIIGLDQVRFDGTNLVTDLSNAQIGALPLWND